MTGQDDTKARLLEAAGQEFAERGYEGATVRSIIHAAGANLAAVNYHFGDKERLYEATVLEAYRFCGDEMESVGNEEDASLELARIIRQFLASFLGVDRMDSWHHALMLREMMYPSKACEALVRELIGPRFSRMASVITRLRPDLSGRELNATVFSVVGQCLYYKVGRAIAQEVIGVREFKSLDLDFLSEHICRFTLNGLGVGGGVASDHSGGTGSRGPGL